MFRVFLTYNSNKCLCSDFLLKNNAGLKLSTSKRLMITPKMCVFPMSPFNEYRLNSCQMPGFMLSTREPRWLRGSQLRQGRVETINSWAEWCSWWTYRTTLDDRGACDQFCSGCETREAVGSRVLCSNSRFTCLPPSLDHLPVLLGARRGKGRCLEVSVEWINNLDLKTSVGIRWSK